MEYAWKFQRDHGAILETDYPYESGRTGTPGSCRHDQDKVMGRVRTWSTIRRDPDRMKDVLMNQPLTAVLDANSAAFQFY